MDITRELSLYLNWLKGLLVKGDVQQVAHHLQEDKGNELIISQILDHIQLHPSEETVVLIAQAISKRKSQYREYLCYLDTYVEFMIWAICDFPITRFESLSTLCESLYKVCTQIPLSYVFDDTVTRIHRVLEEEEGGGARKVCGCILYLWYVRGGEIELSLDLVTHIKILSRTDPIQTQLTNQVLNTIQPQHSLFNHFILL